MEDDGVITIQNNSNGETMTREMAGQPIDTRAHIQKSTYVSHLFLGGSLLLGSGLLLHILYTDRNDNEKEQDGEIRSD